MKVEIKSMSTDEQGEEEVKVTATAELVGDRVVITGNDFERVFLGNFRTVDEDGQRHMIHEGRAWLENLPRSLHGTFGWAEFTETS